MSNPLLITDGLPHFSDIRPEHVKPAIAGLLAEGRALVEQLLAGNTTYTWDNLVEPLDEMDDRINRAWSPVSHMNAVVNTEALRNVYNECLPLLSEYGTELGQHEGLYQAFRQIADGDEYQRFDTAQKKVIDNALRDFRLSGIELDAAKRDRFKEIMQELSRLSSKYSDNVLDATNAWHKQITGEAQLAGLPESARALAQQTAQQRDLDGWVFTLEFPSYYPVMTYADDRELRKELYTAYVTRASELGPTAGLYDNGATMEKIMGLRHEAARLLGYTNYAERSLATKMADSTDQVIGFLEDLARRSHPSAEQELEAVHQFAHEHGLDDVQAWDIPYYSEKLRQQKYAISQEELKPWFPEPRVIEGLFAIVGYLYGLQIEAVDGVDTWHESSPSTGSGTTWHRARRVLPRPVCPPEQARRRLDGRMYQPARHGQRCTDTGRLPDLQLLTAHRRRSGAVHPRRGHHAVPRVRPRPAPHADAGRLPRASPASAAWPGTRSNCPASSWKTGAGSAMRWT